MDSVAQDTRFAIRTLARSPGFTAAALLTLALSIGASTALFSLVEAGLLSTPPYPESDRLVVVDMLFGTPEDPELSPSQWSYPRYRALSEEMTAVDQLAGYGSRTMTLTELGDPAVVYVEVATPFGDELLGLHGFEPSELIPELCRAFVVEIRRSFVHALSESLGDELVAALQKQ